MCSLRTSCVDCSASPVGRVLSWTDILLRRVRTSWRPPCGCIAALYLEPALRLSFEIAPLGSTVEVQTGRRPSLRARPSLRGGAGCPDLPRLSPRQSRLAPPSYHEKAPASTRRLSEAALRPVERPSGPRTPSPREHPRLYTSSRPVRRSRRLEAGSLSLGRDRLKDHSHKPDKNTDKRKCFDHVRVRMINAIVISESPICT